MVLNTQASSINNLAKQEPKGLRSPVSSFQSHKGHRKVNIELIQNIDVENVPVDCQNANKPKWPWSSFHTCATHLRYWCKTYPCTFKTLLYNSIMYDIAHMLRWYKVTHLGSISSGGRDFLCEDGHDLGIQVLHQQLFTQTHSQSSKFQGSWFCSNVSLKVV